MNRDLTSLPLGLGDLADGVVAVRHHGTDATSTRPANAAMCYWAGTAEPSNAEDGDLWSSEDEVLQRRVDGEWREFSSPEPRFTYLGDSENRIIKVSPSGDVVWTYSIGGGAWHEMTVFSLEVDPDGYVYAGTREDDDQIVKIDPDGDEMWREVIGPGAIQAVAIAPDGSVYACVANTNEIYKFTSGGSDLWVEDTGGWLRDAVATDDGVYAASGTNAIRLNPSGGQEWSFPLGENANAIEVDSDGFTYVGSNQGGLWKLDQSGNEVWSLSDAVGYIRVNQNGDLFTTYWGDDSIKMRDPDDGSVVWSLDVPGGFTVDPDGFFHVADNESNTGRKYSPDGVLVWELDLVAHYGRSDMRGYLAADPGRRTSGGWEED